MRYEDLDDARQSHRPRFSEEFFLLFGSVLACAVIFGILYYLFTHTEYIRLDVQPPGLSQHWFYTEETVWNWQSNKQFFVRKMNAETPGDTINRDSILTYLDQWLTSHQWERANGSVRDLCSYLPDQDLQILPRKYLLTYIPINNLDIDPQTTCVAVWPTFPNATTPLHITLVTINPTPLTKLISDVEPPK